MFPCARVFALFKLIFFVLHRQNGKYCFYLYFSKSRLGKVNKMSWILCYSWSPSVPPLVCGAECARCICDRRRCGDSMREVHGCVMKPIITGWKTGIVCAIDKSLSVTSAVFCQRPVFLLSFFSPSQTAEHLPLQHKRHHSHRKGVRFAIIHDLHLILGYDSFCYNTVEPQV